MQMPSIQQPVVGAEAFAGATNNNDEKTKIEEKTTKGQNYKDLI